MFGQMVSFDDFFTASHIAEPLVSVTQEDGDSLAGYFERYNFDAVGFKEGDRVIGYIEKSAVVDPAHLVAAMRPFDIADIITNNTPLMDCMTLLETKPRLFVMDKSQVSSIITVSDIQKAAVRMLFFGVVTLFESEATRLIHETYPHAEWQQLLTSGRVDNAAKLYAELQGKNQEMHLINCTQFCDKTEILMKNSDFLRTYIGLSKTKAEALFERAEDFRNDLAHAQPLNVWFEEKEVVTLVRQLKAMTERMVQR